MPSTTVVNEDTDPRSIVDLIVHESKSLSTPLAVPGGNAEAIKKYAKDLDFMHEKVEVMVLPTNDARGDSSRLVTVGVNGIKYYMLRGEWTTVPRFVLEILATARQEHWHFESRVNVDRTTSDVSQSHQVLRYPHQYRDQNPDGPAWYESLKDFHR